MKTRLATLGLIMTILTMLMAPIGAMAQTGNAAQIGDGFTDVPASFPNAEAINWLAQRGFAKGYGDGTFGVNDPIVRGQVAGLIARPLGWQFEDWSNTFQDQGSLDADLWRNVGALNHYDVARGFQDGTFRPLDNVVKAQMISFITRAMVTKGYWQPQADVAGLYAEVPGDSGHRTDLATYQHYVGGIYGTPSNASLPDWNQNATRAWVAQVLYDALKQMPAVSVPVTGSGNFSGLLNVTSFVPNAAGTGINAIVNVVNAKGETVVSNLTVPVDLAATQLANAAASSAGATAQATCDILHLVLGPLDLNLLGLVVHLDKVVLDITAQSGTNNLLGNLLCAVVNLLNPGGLLNLTSLLSALNNLLTALSGINLPISAPATVTGAMKLNDFSRVGDRLLANGTLGNQPVSLPLGTSGVQQNEATAQATCNVLNLVLGPLDLNLLGLVVHLDKVVLNITAQSGSGNLLGNLLCAVAGLLNPVGSLSQFLDLLNNILRSF
jgi:hypothetical protein